MAKQICMITNHLNETNAVCWNSRLTIQI